MHTREARSMDDAGDPGWQKRYQRELDRLEGELRRLQEVEALLRRLASRLCLLAHQDGGASLSLTDRLAVRLREAADVPSLNAWLSELTPLIARYQSSLASESVASSPIAVRSDTVVIASSGADLVLALLERIALSEPRREQAKSLLEQMSAPDADADQHRKLGQLADLINQQQDELQDALAQFRDAFRLVNQRLVSLFSEVAAEAQAQEASQDSGRTLEQDVLAEVSTLGASVLEARSLDGLRGEVEQRLSRIDAHVKAFRARQQEQQQAYEQRAVAMRDRIQALESQTAKLESSMRDQQRRALTDGLTGVPNRLAYEKISPRLLKDFAAHGQGLCLAVWDIDHFKAVNDNFGHKAGDRALKLVARNLSEAIGDKDFLARYGGEEFVLWLKDMAADQAPAALNRIRQKIAGGRYRHGEHPVTLTVSCGATLVRLGDSLGQIFERADAALFEAKRQGRNRVVIR